MSIWCGVDVPVFWTLLEASMLPSWGPITSFQILELYTTRRYLPWPFREQLRYRPWASVQSREREVDDADGPVHSYEEVMTFSIVQPAMLDTGIMQLACSQYAPSADGSLLRILLRWECRRTHYNSSGEQLISPPHHSRTRHPTSTPSILAV